MLSDNFYFIIDKNFECESPFAIIKFNSSHVIFKAHFPNHPITPGVCQIQIITEILSDYIGQEISLIAAKNIKYISVISPDKESTVKVVFHKKQIDNDLLKVTVTLENDNAIFSKMSMTYRLINSHIKE